MRSKKKSSAFFLRILFNNFSSQEFKILEKKKNLNSEGKKVNSERKVTIVTQNLYIKVNSEIRRKVKILRKNISILRKKRENPQFHNKMLVKKKKKSKF